jgi:hypothetical protein
VSEKRREDEAHDIGDSTPGTVGDSDGMSDDDPESPMTNVRNRRHGELLTESETEAFLDDSEDTRPTQKSREERLSEEEYERQEREKLVHRSAKNYGHYWSEEKQLEYLQEYGKTPEEMSWNVELPAETN